MLLMVVFAAYTASFACVVLERREQGGRPDGRSVCVCGRRIPMWRNIPVVTWLLQRGRAHCCGARIPVWYLGAEGGTAVAAAIGGLVTWPVVWVGGLIGTATAISALAIWFARRRQRPFI